MSYPGSRPYAVEYLHNGAAHHTVVMAPGAPSARSHVRVSRPGATVLRVYRVVSPPGFTLARQSS